MASASKQKTSKTERKKTELELKFDRRERLTADELTRYKKEKEARKASMDRYVWAVDVEAVGDGFGKVNSMGGCLSQLTFDQKSGVLTATTKTKIRKSLKLDYTTMDMDNWESYWCFCSPVVKKQKGSENDSKIKEMVKAIVNQKPRLKSIHGVLKLGDKVLTRSATFTDKSELALNVLKQSIEFEDYPQLQQFILFDIEGLNPKEAVSQYMNSLDEIFDQEECNLNIISDNPAYDVGHMNWLIKTHTNRKTLLFDSKGRYNGADGNVEYVIKSLVKRYCNGKFVWDQSVIDKALSEHVKTEHDHMPDNDAEDIIERMIVTINAVIQHTRSIESTSKPKESIMETDS